MAKRLSREQLVSRYELKERNILGQIEFLNSCLQSVQKELKRLREDGS